MGYAVDLRDEPGIGSTGGSLYVALPTGNVNTVVGSVSIQAPTTGYGFAMTTGWMENFSNVSTTNCGLITETSWESGCRRMVGHSLDHGQITHPALAVSRLFSVASAGAVTIRQVCSSYSGPTVHDHQISAIYFSTAF